MLITIGALAAGMCEARGLWRMQFEGPGSHWSLITPSWLMAAAMAAVLQMRMRKLGIAAIRKAYEG